MALSEIHNKKVSFVTTLTNANLPYLYKYRNSGDLIISYNLDENSTEPPHLWAGGTHIASGYGQDSTYKRDTLSYLTYSYDAVWQFINAAYAYTTSYIANYSHTVPIINSYGYRSMILKDDGDYSNAVYGNQSVAFGKHAIVYQDASFTAGFHTYTTNNGESAFGAYNLSHSYVFGHENEYSSDYKHNYRLQTGVNAHDKIDYTIFSVGVGYPCLEDPYEEERNSRINAIEILANDDRHSITNGSIYIKGIGNFDGTNAIDPNVESFQSYIANAYSYSLHYAKKYTDDTLVNLVGGAPETLDTLKEIADWISDNDEEKTGTTFKEVIDYNEVADNILTKKYYINAWDTSIDDIQDNIEKLLREYYSKGYIKITDIRKEVDTDTWSNIVTWCEEHNVDYTDSMDVDFSRDDYSSNDYVVISSNDYYQDYNHEKIYNFYNYLHRYELLTIEPDEDKYNILLKFKKLYDNGIHTYKQYKKYVESYSSSSSISSDVIDLDGNDTVNTADIYWFLDNAKLYDTSEEKDKLSSTVDAVLESYDFTGLIKELNENKNYVTANSIIEQVNASPRTIKLYCEYTSSKLITDVHEIQASYVTRYGVLANVNENWVTSLGTEATMNVVLRALLTQPNYTKPTLSVTCTPQGTQEWGTVITPKLTFKLNNTYTNPEYVDNYTNQGLGYTYSYLQADNTFYGTEISFMYNAIDDNAVDTSMTTNSNNVTLPNITLDNEGEFHIVDNINFTYLHPTYMFFDQLLQQHVQVIAAESPEHPWYSDGIAVANTSAFNINARYKYFYGWDNTNISDSSIETASFDWVPTSGSTTKTVSFNTKHSSIWIAYPYEGVAACELTNTDSKSYKLLHHTAIVDQNAESNSSTTTIRETNSITLAKIKYKVYTVNFNRANGNTGEYIKFTITRK